MFWFKTHGLSVFLFWQLIVQFELKSVQRTDNDNNVDDAETTNKGDNEDGFERQEVIDEIRDINNNEIEIEKVDIPYKIEEVGIPSNLVSKDNKKTKSTNKLERVKVGNIETVDADTDLIESLESQDSSDKIKDIDEDDIEINQGKFLNNKTKEGDKVITKRIAKKFGIPPFNGSANPKKKVASIYEKKANIIDEDKLMKVKNKSKKISDSPTREKNKDYGLDDFWVDQPLDFYNYFQLTTSKPKPTMAKFALMDQENSKSLKKLVAKKFVAMDKEKPKLMKKMLKMKNKAINLSPTKGRTDDYAFDDFWVDQPFDFYHYFQFTTTPKPTTVAPYFEYYYDEYKDAYVYDRLGSQDYSPTDEKVLLKHLDSLSPESKRTSPKRDGILSFIVDLKKKQEDSEWTKFPGIKIVDGEIYFRGFSVRKISGIGDSEHARREIDQNMKKKIMNNMMAMIPEKVMTKLNSKYNGAVRENLSSKIFGTSFEPRNIKIGKQERFKNNWTLLPGTKIIGNQLYVNKNIFNVSKFRDMFT